MSPFSQKYLVLSAKNHHQNDYSKNVPQGPDSGCIGLYVFKGYTAKYRVFLSDLIRVTNIWDGSVLIWIIESILLRHCVKRRRGVDVMRRVWMTQPRMIVYSHKVRSILEKHLSRLDSPLRGITRSCTCSRHSQNFGPSPFLTTVKILVSTR